MDHDKHPVKASRPPSRRVVEARALMALALTLGLLAAGCGGGNGSSSGTPRAGGRSTGATSPGTPSRRHSRASSHHRVTSGTAYAGRQPTSGGGARTPPPPPPPHTPHQRHNYAAVVATVRAVIAGIDANDASICSRLFTRHYVESVNGHKGSAALALCQQNIRAFRGKVNVVRIERVQGDDRFAVVQFVTTLQGKTTRQTLQLVHTGGRWGVYAALRPAKS
jgi:hypothetical protein